LIGKIVTGGILVACGLALVILRNRLVDLLAPWSSPFRRRRPNATWLDVGRAVIVLIGVFTVLLGLAYMLGGLWP
jgi:hypothetical protein